MSGGTVMRAMGRAGAAGLSLLRWAGGRAEARVVDAVGGPARARVILLLGAVLALNTADASTVGAVAAQLEPSLHIGNTQVGLLSSVSLIVGAVFAIPAGMFVDRLPRVHVLAVSIVLWSVASLASGLANSYSTLLLTRLALGAVTAIAGPAIASLTGDYFPVRERVRVYGYILAGEIAGTAVGFLISGSIAGALSWRYAFFVLAIPGFWLARELWRTLPEPQRGGTSRLQRGAADLAEAARGGGGEDSADEPARDDELAEQAVRARGVRADPRQTLREDPSTMPLLRAMRYLLSVPTNVVLIIASALGYFFLTGLQTFAIVFVRGRYDASQTTATGVLGLIVLAALLGTLVSGPLTGWLLRAGLLNARIWVPAIAYLAATILLGIGILNRSLTPAIWFYMGGTAALSAANPPLDAARLDIIPAGLWGRAESLRTALRTVGQAIAPLLVGAIADLVVGAAPHQAPVGTQTGDVSAVTARGLEYSFLLTLVALAAAGTIMLKARHTYAQDVATASAAAGPAAP